MYRRAQKQETPPENFELPFGGKLASDNRWVIMANMIPWSEFEAEYAAIFSEEIGAPAKTFRMALGALIIKEKLGISDRETVEQIRENPYLQYFIGMSAYSNKPPFDPSMLVHFRERIDINLVNKLNREIVKQGLEINEEAEKEKKSETEDLKSEMNNRGKLILDASCAPADISYPTDLGLLNQARKHTETIIDILYNSLNVKTINKPRTYRNIARKNYLLVAKKRKVTIKERRKAIKSQLQYIKRNLSHIQQLIDVGASLLNLSNRQYKMLLVVGEIYRQQLWLYENKKQSIEDRIVSLSQPHIRPIIRGKAGKPVEFGAKLSASCYDGYVFLDHISWDNFNESGDLKSQVEAYKTYTGYYPESVHVDKIYRTRENRDWCKERGIRISGPPLGRPPKNVSKEKKKQAAYDERIRNCIEGKFGQGKRRFSLGRVMAKLPHTSLTSIAITFLVMNLSTRLSRVFSVFLWQFFQTTSFFVNFINTSYVLASRTQQKLIFSFV
ncbi:IS5 family transposase [Anabaena cylindrica FACHB-243]|uniref:IS5 family transposase n=1 Tax=Anabaena TaxID=1163 RepID=UPI000A2F6002|nr:MULTISPECIES: IS5 family transposase [Anabaena]MBD2419791.1 IS5 family transposase [Anabaena cylindrica FACHB-243]MBY5285806.1 IS5 family transposase [Anabaena sp. CCAP 1446/1C]MBY5308658.1 IS5 family transposase [Anabaena sp. CCAP 1446/1C]MCM2409683.1 IS5 family transposase [Anabaena sp. CCAP 1446/1C]BAY06180.1 transposase [Anabaena cylindrica PCC 7122]